MRRLGLLSFSDGRDRVHASLAPDIERHQSRITARLVETGEIVVTAGSEIVHSNDSARAQARHLAALSLDGVIFNIPVFAFPNYIVLAARLLGPVPLLLLGPQDPRYPGLTGLLAAGGALHQIDIPHERLWMDLDDPTLPAHLLAFARAAGAAARLRGQVYGLIGGRSIGMLTGAASPELWQKQFGVDIDHVDQSEIVRLARLAPDEEVARAKEWIRRHVREIVFDGVQLTPEKWDFQIRCYLALKDIVARSGFDFAGIKCHYELSEFHAVQCVSAAFMNDPYDWDGPKTPVPLACEADSDGALTMRLLQMVASRPACLLDLRFFDQAKQVYVMPNCGSAPTWFAAQSADPAVNLARVRVVPSIGKYAGGGAHFQFVFKESELTLARLTRSSKGYRMVIMGGESVALDPKQVTGAADNWPHAFVRLALPPSSLIQRLQANHLHAVAGDYRRELVTMCRLLGVEPEVVDRESDLEGDQRPSLSTTGLPLIPVT
jgi:L-fucose isomerase